jgi:Calcineurin-like phosphoesterase
MARTEGRRRPRAARPAPLAGNRAGRRLEQPVFAQPQPTPDPTLFRIRHASDAPAYKVIDLLNREHRIAPLPFPPPRGLPEPRLALAQALGGDSGTTSTILRAGQLVFHATGDCGSTRGPATQNQVADKMVGDFAESAPREVPQFALLLGDIVYSFDEPQYFYDQFYEPYRDYPAPILALAGNHDGMVSPFAHAASLAAFLRNFCATGFIVTPEAGGLSRTAQIQPGVFYTFEAPFVRILALYSNTLEDPGVIADRTIGNSQQTYLRAALTRVKDESYAGALLIAHHHPPYCLGGNHGWSIAMQAQIDAICSSVGVWPHAVLSGHAHNYQRFTRTRPGGQQIPYIVCGNGGHALVSLTRRGEPPLRAPQIVQSRGSGTDQIVFENYDCLNYGYLRVVVTAAQLRIEYHPASDANGAKTPDDAVTVDLATRRLTQFLASDLGWERAGRAVRAHRPRGGIRRSPRP